MRGARCRPTSRCVAAGLVSTSPIQEIVLSVSQGNKILLLVVGRDADDKNRRRLTKAISEGRACVLFACVVWRHRSLARRATCGSEKGDATGILPHDAHAQRPARARTKHAPLARSRVPVTPALKRKAIHVHAPARGEEAVRRVGTRRGGQRGGPSVGVRLARVRHDDAPLLSPGGAPRAETAALVLHGAPAVLCAPPRDDEAPYTRPAVRAR